MSSRDPPANSSMPKEQKKKKLKYYNPGKSSWTEASYHRDYETIPDNESLNHKAKDLYTNPLLKEVMYPIIGYPSNSTLMSSNQSRATERCNRTSPSMEPSVNSTLMSSNQSRAIERCAYEARASETLEVDVGNQPYHEGSDAESYSLSSIQSYLEDIDTEVKTLVAKDIQKFLPPNSNFIGDWYGDDNIEDGDYYYSFTSLEELHERIRDSDKLDCLGMLRYLRIDWLRLKMRPEGGNVDSAKTFMRRMIDYFANIEHPVLHYLDQAWFIITFVKRSVYIHANTIPQTGKVAQVKKVVSGRPEKYGSVDYYNPLYLMSHLTIDQQIYIGKMLLPNDLMTNRKAKLLHRLVLLWKNGNQSKRKEIYETIGLALTYLTIQSPLHVKNRAVSAQVLRRTKGSVYITDNISFKAYLVHYKGINASLDCGVYLLCGPLPERIPEESRVKHLHSEPMYREKTMIKYPKDLKVYLNGRYVSTGLFDDLGGTLYPREITEYVRYNDWNIFHVTFELDEELFIRGLVLHVVQGRFNKGKGMHES